VTYAAKTNVSPDRTRAEIEKTLTRYGAKQFMFGHDPAGGIVAFTMHGRQIRFTVAFPAEDSRDIAFTATGLRRTPAARQDAMNQAVRQRWRAMLLIIKAKLEAVESGVVSFESEFLAQTVLPNNTTVADYVMPKIDEAYESGEIPALLPSFNAKAITA
jgi:hypothetical protein